MSQLHLPWLEISILLPIMGAIWAFYGQSKQSPHCQRHSLYFSGATLLSTCAAWRDFISLHTFEAHDSWDLFALFLRKDVFVIDELSAPLIPLAALLYFLTQLATQSTKVRRFSFFWSFVSEAILIMTFSCKSPMILVSLLTLGVLPMIFELTSRGKPIRVYCLHMGLYVILLLSGQMIIEIFGMTGTIPTFGVLLLTSAVLIRDGIIPLHCWMTDLFEHGSFGSSLLFVTPMVGAYGTMRLIFPIAPAWILESIAIVSLITAFYAAGMSLVQREARRFFTYLFLSNSSLVLIGVEIATPIGLTGALCVWLSVSLSLMGFGLTLRAVEARTGRLSLDEYHGLYERMPHMAGFFLLTGMASIGFPGTIGFIGAELLVDGAGQISMGLEVLIILATALNGLAVLHAYFRVFTGKHLTSTIDIRSRPAERAAVLVLSILILGAGLYPHPGISSRYHAALELLSQRENLFPLAPFEDEPPETREQQHHDVSDAHH